MTHKLYNADNLEFLEWLNKQDGGTESIDLCYIDPPYNTGNTGKNFVYDDCFKKSASKTKHEVWLDFMRPRIEKTIPLLKDSGILAVSIDDSEVHHLRIMLDELLGEKNFIAQMVVDGGNVKNNARFISTTHEYVLVYAKNLTHLNKTGVKWRQEREGLKVIRRQERILRKEYGTDYATMSTELKKWLKTAPVSARLKVFYNVDARGIYTYADLSAPNSGAKYEVLHPETQKPVTTPTRGWALKEENLKELIENDLVIFGTGPDGHEKQPLKKLYLENKKDQVIRSIISYPSRTSTHLLEKILGERGIFNNPKNLDMMKFLIDTMTPSDGVVLDYFAGSASTGHAVIELNEKNKDSQRKFILCTNNENGIYENVAKPRIEAVISGAWLNWTYHRPKKAEVTYFDEGLSSEP
ncbi:MAG: site-specific DNA-methyltransferase [Enterococcus sp.]|nr:site-specific DNA-methyltransferase [Enterococcus sp.]